MPKVINRVLTEVWTTGDVQSIRDDLSDAQALRVLESLAINYSSDTGINWDVLEAEAEYLYPEEGSNAKP